VKFPRGWRGSGYLGTHQNHPEDPGRPLASPEKDRIDTLREHLLSCEWTNAWAKKDLDGSLEEVGREEFQRHRPGSRLSKNKARNDSTEHHRKIGKKTGKGREQGGKIGGRGGSLAR